MTSSSQDRLHTWNHDHDESSSDDDPSHVTQVVDDFLACVEGRDVALGRESRVDHVGLDLS